MDAAAPTNWRDCCRDHGVVPGPARTAEQPDGAATALGRPIVGTLRALYLLADGFYDERGQWDVVWPLDDLVVMNRNFVATAAGFVEHSIAFGNDGAGQPLIARADGSSAKVIRWSLIDDDVDFDEGDFSAFGKTWLGLQAWPPGS